MMHLSSENWEITSVLSPLNPEPGFALPLKKNVDPDQLASSEGFSWLLHSVSELVATTWIK